MNIDRIARVKRSKAFTVLDVVLVCVLVIGIALGAWAIYRKPALSVVISEGGKTRTLPIDADATVVLEHLTVHIEGGKVWVTDADCADGICVETGAISRAGQRIVCLPNAVIISLEGSGDLQWEIG